MSPKGEKTQYKHVRKFTKDGIDRYRAYVKKKNQRVVLAFYPDIEEAALRIDTELIKAGYEPVNKLKRK